jgi:pyridoxamine 5'-phosphate oxidase
VPNTPLPELLPADPLPLLGAWLDEAIARLADRNPTAMTIATADAEGRPAARMVLCRGYDAERGSLVFFTDSRSQKGRELARRPRAAFVFYWYELDRQVRGEGPVLPVTRAETEAYFATRPGGAQLAAWASEQSEPLASRAALIAMHRAMSERFGVATDAEAPASVPPPPLWTGYRVWLERLEFWVGQASRLHDRARYDRELEPTPSGVRAGPWRATRLQP